MPQNHVEANPCDGHGNCISSYISYVRSNPDQSLYLGDEFAVAPSVSLGTTRTAFISPDWIGRLQPAPCSRRYRCGVAFLFAHGSM